MNTTVRRAIAWTALFAAMAAALAWTFWPQPVPVETMTVTRGPLQAEVSDEGRTRVRETYQVTAPVAGQMARIDLHPGDPVIGGKTVVADLWPIPAGFLDVRSHAQAQSAVKSAEAARDAAEAEMDRVNAQLAFAANDLERARRLSDAHAIAKADVERAELAYNTAAAQLATARAAFQAKGFDLTTARALLIDPGRGAAAPQRLRIPLLAPVSGRILRVLHESESSVAAGTPLLEIGDTRLLEIVVDLISEDAVKVREGMPATITDWGGAAALQARVRRVEPAGFTKVSALGVEEQRVNILLDFTDPVARWNSIADGFRIVAHNVVWQSPNVLRLPVTALFRHGDGWGVFAVEKGRAVMTPVSIGHGNDQYAELLGGLKEGARVIVHPSDRVADGVRLSLH